MGEQVAVVGYACRLPGAADAHAFWQVLLDGRCTVTTVPSDRFPAERYQHPRRGTPGKSVTFAAGVLDNVFDFDAAFFGITPREAEQMDPQQRLLLEVSWECLEHAGIPPSSLSGSRTGVYVGASSSDYFVRFVLDPAAIDTQMMTGNTLSIISNRLSYHYNLKGPSLTIDTACSSSLFALHHACEAIRSQEIDTAIVAGVNALGAPYPFLGFSRAFMLSEHGLCRAFDAEGDGYVRAEGAAVFVIQSLAAATRQGRKVHALVVGTGVNSDGRTAGLSMPSTESQRALLQDVYDKCAVAPDALAFVEAHGTGTRVGDPAEADALGKVLGVRRSRPLPIGSVKTNIGHLEAGSGLVGVLKAICALNTRTFPRSLHFRTPNPDIPFEDLNLRVASEAVRFSDAATPQFAGINSFGFGGANAHVVIREGIFPASTARDIAPKPTLISAQSPQGLMAVAARLQQLVDRSEPQATPAISNAAAHTRDALEHRAIIFADDKAELAATLGELANDRKAGNAVRGRAALRAGPVAFAFSGNGSQHPGMGVDAYAKNKRFRDRFNEVEEIVRATAGWSLVDIMTTTDSTQKLSRAEFAQPLLFGHQVATVAALAEFGLVPCAVFGHSVGEIAAACTGGALDLEQATRVVLVRSKLQESVREKGGMIAIALTLEVAAAAIGEFEGLEIAAVNSPRSLTISGPRHSLDSFIARARKERWPCRRLDLEYPYHNSLIEPIRDELLAELHCLRSTASSIPFISGVTGKQVSTEPLDARYWWDNVRRPVLFADAARTACEFGPKFVIEIGPAPVLTGYLSDVFKDLGKQITSLPSLDRGKRKIDPITHAAALAFANGAPVSLDRLFGEAVHPATDLPAYPWQRERFRIEAGADAIPALEPSPHPLLGTTARADSRCYFNQLDIETFPWLADHKVEDATVLPAAAILEIGLAAARATLGEGALELRSAAILRALVLRPGVLHETMTRVIPEESLVDLFSRPRGAKSEWLHHARVTFGRPPKAAELISAPSSLECARAASAEDVYRRMETFRLHYGPAFRRVDTVKLQDETTCHVTFTQSQPVVPGLILDPTVLDAALHTVLWTLYAHENLPPGDFTVLPIRVESLRVYQPNRAVSSARVRVDGRKSENKYADIDLLADDNSLVASLRQGQFVELRLHSANEPAERLTMIGVPLVGGSGKRAKPLVKKKQVMSEASGSRSKRRAAFKLIDRAAHKIAYATLLNLHGPGIQSGIVQETNGGCTLTELLLRHLRASRLAFKSESGWSLVSHVPGPDVDTLINRLLREHPEFAAEATLLASLPAILSARLAQTDNAVAPALWDSLANGSPFAAARDEALLRAFDEEARLRGDSPLRVLLAGTVPSALVRQVIEQVPHTRGTVTLTSIDASRGQEPASQFVRDGLVSVRTWEQLETDPKAVFDVALGADFIDRAPDPKSALRTIRRLLPGGTLLFNASRASLLRDLMTLLDPSREQSSTSEGANVEDPAANLRELGFTDVRELSADETNQIIVAHSPADIQLQNNVLPFEAGAIGLLGSEADVMSRDLSAFLTRAGRTPQPISIDLIGERAAGHSLPLEAVYIASRSAAADPQTWVLAHCENIKKLLDLFSARAARLWFVLPGGANVANGHEPDPATAALWGYVRVAMNEYPGLDIRLVDPSSRHPNRTPAQWIAQEITSARNDHEIFRKGDSTWGIRIVPAPQGSSVSRVRSHKRQLVISAQGSLDRLKWNEVPLIRPRADEVEIQVCATGVNFRDIMWTLGLLPSEALQDGFAGPTLGMECAGIVTQVGSKVSGFRPGDRCLAFAPAAFASHVTVPAYAVTKLPPRLTFEEAATIPVAFLTAFYSLIHLARLQPTESILIHGGAGGVGLAALQIAKLRGAKIFMTAGTSEKRALLRQLGAAEVYDSRSLSFADEILDHTEGQGVDVVLNSLAGEAMERSIACLKPFGRFVELGKRDFFEDSRIGLRPFRKNLSYFGVDADQLLTTQQPLARKLFRELLSLFAKRKLVPLPYRTFDGEDVTSAFRLMQQSGHIGKVVVRPAKHVAMSSRKIIARANASYVIVGGLGGFGLQLARRLAERGARHLALIGRSGASTTEAREIVESLRAAGVSVAVEAFDAAERKPLAALFKRLARAGTPVRGVFHAAMVLRDTLIRNSTPEANEAVLRAKLRVADNLHVASRGLDLDWFVLFSSATTLVGNPGQANYVAANAYLEALVRKRRLADLPALAVAWGAVSDVGYLARNTGVSRILSAKLGRHMLRSDEALTALEDLLSQDQRDPARAAIAVARLDWAALGKELPLVALPLFDAVRSERDSADEKTALADLATVVAALPADEAKEKIAAVLSVEIGKIMRITPTQVDQNKPLSEMGVDSLMGLELRLAAEEKFGIPISLMSIEGAGTLRDLAARIHEQLVQVMQGSPEQSSLRKVG